MKPLHATTHRSPRLWHPRYWASWLAVGVLYLLSRLTFRVNQAFGEWLGHRLYRLAKSRARVTRQNLAACFPEWSTEKVDEVARQTFVEVARGFTASLYLWSHPLSDITSRTEYVGIEYLIEAEAAGKGVFLIGGHYSPIELGFLLFLNPTTTAGYMYRANDNPVLDYMIERGRRRQFNITAFDKFQGRELMEFLKSGGEVGYACDQDFNDKTTLFVPFLGVDAPCIDKPSVIARKSGASVMFVRFYRTGNDRYRVEYSPIQENFGEDAKADALAWNRYIEQTVRDHPAQYFWLHKRFKTRPEGAPPIY